MGSWLKECLGPPIGVRPGVSNIVRVAVLSLTSDLLADHERRNTAAPTSSLFIHGSEGVGAFPGEAKGIRSDNEDIPNAIAVRGVLCWLCVAEDETP